jgi:hypothetical protein
MGGPGPYALIIQFARGREFRHNGRCASKRATRRDMSRDFDANEAFRSTSAVLGEVSGELPQPRGHLPAPRGHVPAETGRNIT